jgi:molybdopterin-guanine dinucleotide biosynthesis protein A
MGRDKRFLPIRGQPMVAWVLDRVCPLVDEMLLVTLEPALFAGMEARVVTDHYPGMGVLAGVHAGLAAARGEWAFVVAADMPLLNPDLLRGMVARASEACDVVVPRWRGNLEPLHALYRPAACANAAEAALLRGQRRIIAFYDDVRVCAFAEESVARYAPEGASFFNVNTPGDWAEARRRLGEM